MASLATHFSSFIILCPVGIRRWLCSFSLYQRNPSIYSSRIWYFSEPKWKNLDLYTLLIVLPIAIFSQLFIFFVLSGDPTYRFSFLQRSFVLFFFWSLLVLIILRENLNLYSVSENFVFLLAGIAFLIDFYMNGRGFVGLSGVVYGILGCLSAFCAGCCIYLSVKPSAFFAEFMFSSGLVLRGSWSLQVGLSLYTDLFIMNGCAKISPVMATNGKIDLKCELEGDRQRGVALMNLFFLGHVIVIMITSLILFSILHCNGNRRSSETSGRLLAEMGSEAMLLHPLPEFEIE